MFKGEIKTIIPFNDSDMHVLQTAQEQKSDLCVPRRLNQRAHCSNIRLNYVTSEPVVSIRPGVTTTAMVRQEPECHGHRMRQQMSVTLTCTVTPHSTVQAEESEEVKTENVEGHVSNNLQPLGLSQKKTDGGLCYRHIN